MANLAQNNSPKPLSAPGGAFQLTSGVAPAAVCHKLAITFSATGNLTILALDGTSVTLSSMPIGHFQFDIQFQSVTWTGTATAVGFYRIDG